MYRLLQINKPNLRLSYRKSFQSFDENVEPRCQFCLLKNYATKPNVSIQPKKRRKKSAFAELLVVTGNSSIQRRASIQKLTPKDLKLLALTNLNLNELYKLKTLSKKSFPSVEQHTYNNLNFMGGVPIATTPVFESIKPQIEVNEEIETKLNELMKPSEELEPTELADSIERRNIENVFQAAIEEEEEDVVEEHHEKLTKKNLKDTFNQEYAEEITNKTVASFIDVCSVLRNPQRGLNALNFSLHKQTGHRKNVRIKHVVVYNALLKGFAQKGDYNKIQEVLQLMNQSGIQLNVQSHVYVFECLGRINIKNNHQKEIRAHVNKFREHINFDDIMNKGYFYDGQREMVLNAIKAHTPEYIPTYFKPDIKYSNHLVNHLNNIKMMNDANCGKKSGLFIAENLEVATLEQIELEKKGYVTIKSIEDKGPISQEVMKYRNDLKDHYQMWEKDATLAFNRDLSALAAKRSALNMEPYLRCIPAKDFVSIIVEEAKKIAQGSETYSPTAPMLYKNLGRKVYERYRVLNKEKTGALKKIKQIHLSYCNEYAKIHPELDVCPLGELEINMRQIWQQVDHDLKNTGATLTTDHQEWVPTTLRFIGRFLYHIVMHDLKIDVNSMTNLQHKNFVPAFYTIFRVQNRIPKEEVKPHPILSKLHRSSLPATLTFPASELPMICPPLPWVSVDLGGYLLTNSDLVRLPYQATSQKQRMAEVATQQIYPSLDALNQLSAVPWKVNQSILDVVLKVFNSGGSASLDIPEPPSSLSPPPYATADMDKSQRYQLFKKKMQYRRKKGEMFSLWCDCLYRLSLANHFRNNIFWLPHNMDFRGRVYPIPPHLSHMGSDLARSMLIFAESRPLGPEGLKWLKLHLVNLTGLKKRDCVAERLRFADEIMDLILDSADNPLSGKRWWAESDEPWQTLACCMEIADAIRSPDPEKFRSCFPVHQDGSCNGLQHYAALGRDSAGAFSVNLTSFGEPQDVYSAVATLVEKKRIADKENGLEVAKVLEGFVKRKVIKQTVMTTVYGVTRFGAKLQIAKQLKDIDNFPKEHVWSASSYLAARTFDSIACMFTSTRAIQDWFTECARLISQVGGQHVEWVTPLGLPVTQPYFKVKNISSPLCEGFSIDKYEKPNVMKQKNAFPPNFIHSLDSSHMMLTSLNCERSGITFVSVHDCFWTHPSTVHIMNKICREQFVKLHSEPILEDLSYFLVNKYSYGQNDFTHDGSVKDLMKKKLNRVLKQLPKTGDFDLNQVLQSTYFFS